MYYVKKKGKKYVQDNKFKSKQYFLWLKWYITFSGVTLTS
jgi:hypothetical protein